MPFELSAAEQAKRAVHVAALLEARTKVDAAIEAYNDIQQAVREELELQFGRFLETLDAAQAWAGVVVDQATSQLNEKRDQMHNSAAGSEALTWIREWDTALQIPPAIDMPDPVGLDWPDYANELNRLRAGASDRHVDLTIAASRMGQPITCYRIPGRFLNWLWLSEPTEITIEHSAGVIYHLDGNYRRTTALAPINERILSGWDDGTRFVADASVLASVGVRYIGAAEKTTDDGGAAG